MSSIGSNERNEPGPVSARFGGGRGSGADVVAVTGVVAASGDRTTWSSRAHPATNDRAAHIPAAIRAGLVDRYRVVIFPVITGASGKDRIFDEYPDVALDVVERRTFDGRLQLLECVPTLLDGPPNSGG